ncbi:hypothetical protein C8E03_108140 [Lachnotalea glycerini]|uniref:Uncharacterized protein n=1 Tax=Lachnotalea glycerini TaxID=1763509 RepID=A0A318EPW4_9FIRM|nr:hypothetical protein [Lachnotalea glycerini]OYO76068.1 hypothetical protein CG709_16450 [Lachnotalea glycerini]PXV88413.1 hypothetical protein C8E03_108140 [Lachnotalea glycerini]
MAKGDKEFQWRMEGMLFALKIAKQDGVEALENDIRSRNILKAPMRFSPEELESFYKLMSGRIYNNILTIAYAVLHDTFGFRKERLKRFKKVFDEKTMCIADLTRFGNHYVTFTDYAREANEKYNLGIDIDLVSATQDINDETMGKRAKIDAIGELFKEQGYSDAAEFLRTYEFTKLN